MALIKEAPSVVPACDVDTLEQLEQLVRATRDVQGIGGYKIGSILVMRYGLGPVIRSIRSFSNRPIIYDHQKGGTDIPSLGYKFMTALAEYQVDAVILSPLGGAETARTWIVQAARAGLTVLVGGHMTQPNFLKSEGGFVDDEAPEKIFALAAELGVRDFVVPGNKPAPVAYYRKFLAEHFGNERFDLCAPGFISQGGEITETARQAGRFWHAIVGRAIYKGSSPRLAAEKMVQQIRRWRNEL